jgi:Tfp pilus assembly protein PilZ
MAVMSEEGKGRDRRRYPRFRVRLDAAFAQEGEPQPAEVHDISPGGMFLRTDEPRPVGSQLRITLKVPGEQAEERSLEGQVVRVVEVEGDEMPDHVTGMGIEFKLTPEERDRLRKALFGLETEPAD